jgi:hypothetical protein
LGISTALRSKHYELNKIIRKPAEKEENDPPAWRLKL